MTSNQKDTLKNIIQQKRRPSVRTCVFQPQVKDSSHSLLVDAYTELVSKLEKVPSLKKGPTIHTVPPGYYVLLSTKELIVEPNLSTLPESPADMEKRESAEYEKLQLSKLSDFLVPNSESKYDKSSTAGLKLPTNSKLKIDVMQFNRNVHTLRSILDQESREKVTALFKQKNPAATPTDEILKSFGVRGGYLLEEPISRVRWTYVQIPDTFFASRVANTDFYYLESFPELAQLQELSFQPHVLSQRFNPALYKDPVQGPFLPYPDASRTNAIKPFHLSENCFGNSPLQKYCYFLIKARKARRIRPVEWITAVLLPTHLMYLSVLATESNHLQSFITGGPQSFFASLCNDPQTEVMTAFYNTLKPKDKELVSHLAYFPIKQKKNKCDVLEAAAGIVPVFSKERQIMNHINVRNFFFCTGRDPKEVPAMYERLVAENK